MEAILLGKITPCFPSGNDFEMAMLHDAVRLVMECHMHKCGPNCFKYTASRTKYQLCRHMFYHVVTILSQSSTAKAVWIRAKTAVPVQRAKQADKFRLRGKALRNVVGVEPNGRVMPWQMHASEGLTNYCGLVALRCNLDVQDLRRLLARLGDGVPSMLPSPLPSLGPCPAFGWMEAPIAEGATSAGVATTTDPSWRLVLLALMAMDMAPDSKLKELQAVARQMCVADGA